MQARSLRSRRGRPKSGDRASRPEAVADGADGDGEAAPKGSAKAPAGRQLPGRKPTGICAWNPFAGLGPKLMVSLTNFMCLMDVLLQAALHHFFCPQVKRVPLSARKLLRICHSMPCWCS
jgi:hypothetical protein